MPILNVALDGLSLSQPSMNERCEEIMSKCSGFGDIRHACANSSEFEDELMSSMDKACGLVSEQFEHLDLHGVPFL